MRIASIGFLLVAGCGTESSASFVLDTADCALVNNFTVGGAATSWTDCRVHWSGAPDQTLTVELTVPNTTGSFLVPAPGWVRASVHVPGEIDGKLTTVAFEPADQLPMTVDEGRIALDMSIAGGCGNIGVAQHEIDVMADVGADSVSFSMSLSGTCYRSGGQTTYSGGFIVTAAAQAGSMTNADPATPVTTP